MMTPEDEVFIRLKYPIYEFRPSGISIDWGDSYPPIVVDRWWGRISDYGRWDSNLYQKWLIEELWNYENDNAGR